jgi:phosphoserine phosphatase
LRAICDAIPYQPGAGEALATLKSEGLLVGIVSTGLSLLADRVRAEHGLDHAASNVLVARGGEVTGEVRIVIAHGEKDRALRSFCSRFGLEPAQVAAVGDTEGDISMFRAAGWSVAFNAADPTVERAASAVAPGIDLRSVLPLLL